MFKQEFSTVFRSRTDYVLKNSFIFAMEFESLNPTQILFLFTFVLITFTDCCNFTNVQICYVLRHQNFLKKKLILKKFKIYLYQLY